MHTPSLQDLTKAAMKGALSKTAEGGSHAKDCSCDDCKKGRDSEKKAAALTDSEYTSKLASFNIRVAQSLRKEASENPGGVPESHAISPEGLPKKLGKESDVIPTKSAPTTHFGPNSPAANPLTTNAMGKQASTGPGAVPESNATKADGNPAGGKPKGPTGLVASNQAAIDATSKDTYEPRKGEVAAFLRHAKMNEGDQTGQAAFKHIDGLKTAAWIKGGTPTPTAQDYANKTASAAEILATLEKQVSRG